MLDSNDPSAPVGPLFIVDSVVAFHAGKPDGLGVLEEPNEIPGGFMATYQDPGGMVVYVMDQSTDATSPLGDQPSSMSSTPPMISAMPAAISGVNGSSKKK